MTDNLWLELIIENKSWLLQSYCQGSIIAFLLFLVYLEKNPRIKGILIRPGPDQENHFNLEGIIPMLEYPFKSLDFWYPSMWDVNFIVFTQAGAGAYMILKSLLEK